MAVLGMKVNTSKLDRGIRFVIGVCLMIITAPGAGLLGSSIFKVAIFLFGSLNVLTAITGWCGVYQMAGLSSLPASGDSEN